MGRGGSERGNTRIWNIEENEKSILGEACQERAILKDKEVEMDKGSSNGLDSNVLLNLLNDATL